MKNLLSRTGKIVLGFILFVGGLGLIYTGCKYFSSGAAGFQKKMDAFIYLICIVPSVYGLYLLWEGFGLAKKNEARVNDEKKKL